MIKELAIVILTRPLAEFGLTQGCRGTVVHVYKDGQAYEVEFTDAEGRTIDVVTLKASDVRPPTAQEIKNAEKVV